MEEITIWADNCSCQNKNYELFLTVLLFINSDDTATKIINFKFLEKGHTFMSADSFHGLIEKESRRYLNGKQHDFGDFMKVIENAKGKVLKMNIQDFLKPKIKVSQYYLNKLKPRPMISKFISARFEKGNNNIVYKLAHDGPENTFNLLNKKQQQEVSKYSTRLSERFNFECEECGIDEDRKNEIIKDLLPLMPPTRHSSWINLSVKN
jgi:hypothetical protein